MKKLSKLMIATLFAASLAACGGGGGGSSTTAGANDSTGYNNNSGPGVSTPQTSMGMTGIAAVGRALSYTTVTARDAKGQVKTTTTDSNGRFIIDVTGMTAPFVLTATDPFGVAGTQYSVVAALPSSDNIITANVTPLTTAVTALLTSSGNPVDVLTNTTAVTTANVNSAVSKLNVALASMLSANGLSASTFDPISHNFLPNQTGADAVIESVNVTASSISGGLQLTSVADPNTVIQLNGSTTVTTALTAPSQPANFLAGLKDQLKLCAASKSTASTSCAPIINAGYVRAGRSFPMATGLFQNGLTINDVKAVSMFSAGVVPNTTGQTALVYVTYTLASGAQLFVRDFIQQKSDNSWEFVGDQLTKSIAINSFLTKKQLVQDGTVRYEAGIEIVATPTMGEWTSMNVSGPGLPSGGLWLQSLGQTATAAIPSFQTASTFTNPASSIYGSDQITNQYKMTWVDGNGNAVARVNSSDYAPAPVDMSTVPLFSVYTVSLYDSTGALVGTPHHVMNTSAAMTNAVQGVTAQWATLGQDSITKLLTPSGSMAAAPVVDSYGNAVATTLDWSVPSTLSAINVQAINVNVAYMVANNVVGQPDQTMVKTVGGLSSLSSIAKDSTGLQYTGQVSVQTDEALAQEPRRSVQLKWYQNGVAYSGIWQYGAGE